MKKNTEHIVVDEHHISFVIKKRARQKHVRFITHHDGAFVVSVPRSYSQKMIYEMIQNNMEWIRKNVMLHKKCVTIDPCVVRYMKRALRPIIERRLAYFNTHYRYTFQKIHIRYQSTRWGSCSSEGVLSFNCKLMCVSEELRDYVIVHEMCHLWELNHSPAFWSLVAQTIPCYKELRKELKKLHI